MMRTGFLVGLVMLVASALEAQTVSNGMFLESPDGSTVFNIGLSIQTDSTTASKNFTSVVFKEQLKPAVIPAWKGNEKGTNAHQWMKIAAGSAMVASGVLAAILKDRANTAFDQYNQTLDPGQLAASRRLDNQSAAAVVVTQLSLAVLSYLLLAE